MKTVLMWAAAILWFLVYAFMSRSYFGAAFSSDRGLLQRPEAMLTGIGALTVAVLPLVAAALVHRFSRWRLRGRLLRDKERIERRLAQIDAKQAAHAAASRSQGEAELAGGAKR